MKDFDRVKFPPPDDTPMLPWYQGAFSHGFIALHPFFRVEGLDPNSCEHGTLVLVGSDRPDEVDLLKWIDDQSAERRIGKELPSGSISDIAKRFGERIGWLEICQMVGLPDHCALDRTLRTTILGLKRELEDQDAARRLTASCNRHRIFLPTEGAFQPTMEASLVSLFQQMGLSEVLVGDEFGEEERLVSLASLGKLAAWEARTDMPAWGARRLMAPDRSILVWVHWDSFYTALFGTATRLQALQLGDHFEGFWCSDQTTTYWLMQDAIPLVQCAN